MDAEFASLLAQLNSRVSVQAVGGRIHAGAGSRVTINGVPVATQPVGEPKPQWVLDDEERRALPAKDRYAAEKSPDHKQRQMEREQERQEREQEREQQRAEREQERAIRQCEREQRQAERDVERQQREQERVVREQKRVEDLKVLEAKRGQLQQLQDDIARQEQQVQGGNAVSGAPGDTKQVPQQSSTTPGNTRDENKDTIRQRVQDMAIEEEVLKITREGYMPSIISTSGYMTNYAATQAEKDEEKGFGHSFRGCEILGHYVDVNRIVEGWRLAPEWSQDRQRYRDIMQYGGREVSRGNVCSVPPGLTINGVKFPVEDLVRSWRKQPKKWL